MYEDRDEEEREERPAWRVKREPKQPKEIRYEFALTDSMKTPTVRGSSFRLGDVVRTSDGPRTVREIFWASPYEARVLLAPTTK